MLRALLFLPIMLLSFVLAGLCRLLPGQLSCPLRWCELRILYFVYRVGPGGFDDDVQIALMKGKRRYANQFHGVLSPPREVSACCWMPGHVCCERTAQGAR
jgi:hypothetical protein